MRRPARANPFRSSRVESLRYRLDASAWNALLLRFEALGRRAALVGDKGSGKTTLLGEIEKHFESDGWQVCRVRLKAERRRPTAGEWAAVRSAGGRVLVTVDGAEQLSRLDWWRLRRASRRAGGLLVTTHRPGLLPTLHEHRTTPELLRELVEELLDGDKVAENELRELFDVHRGNVRECLRELYDRWA